MFSGAVFGRLYQQALDLRDKLDEQRTWVRDYELEVIKAGKPRMTWSSTAMMQERTAGELLESVLDKHSCIACVGASSSYR